MSDLVEFLRARLDERADAAQAALDFPYEIPQDAPWWAARQRVKQGDPSTGYSSTWDQHVALNDPATVLAEVEAKRRIIAEVEGVDWLPSEASDDEPEYAYGIQRAYYTALKMVALPYADHPDYREEWKP